MKPWATLFATSALVYRAWSHKSLTMPAIAAAAVTGILHGLHPSPAPFLLLAVFFVAGNAVTKVYLSQLSSLVWPKFVLSSNG